MTNSRLTLRPWGLLSLLVVLSCMDRNGVAKPDDPGEALWTLHATLDGKPPRIDGDMHLAFIWRSPVRPIVAEDIAIDSRSPFSVDLRIYELPDESMLTSSDETVPPQLFTWEYSKMVDEDFEPVEYPAVLWSQGKLLLYEDVNRNGELDLMDNEATTPIDRVIGGAFTNDFYYIEGSELHPLRYAPKVTRGLNMVSLAEDRFTRTPISLETDIVLRLDDSPEVQRFMCPVLREKLWTDGRHIMNKRCTVVPPNELLSHFPGGAVPNIDGHCADNGRLFEWFDTWFAEGDICAADYVHADYYMSRLPVEDATPSFWPCETVESSPYGDYPYFVYETVPEDEIGTFDSTGLDACTALTTDLIQDFSEQF